MEYHSAMIKREIMSILTTWLGLKNTMLIEINQRKTNTVSSHFHVESKNIALMGTESRVAVISS